MGSNVVIVENFDLEHTIVGTGTQVGYSQNTGKLDQRKRFHHDFKVAKPCMNSM